MDKIKIGKILNTFGIKGELKIRSYSDFSDERFKVGFKIHLMNDNDEILLEIASKREHKGFLLIKFKNLDNINDVEKYKGYDIFIDKKDLHQLASGEFYFFELVGFSVINENKEKIGEVLDVESGTTCNYLRVLTVNNKKSLIPFCDPFIINTCKENKEITVRVIEGLL
ncbi:MAG: ribosome maturation factor RimM [Anaerorhabdus sp.]